MGATVQSITATGSKGTIVDIECHLSNNLPNIVIVGFANRAVDESRERIRGAFASSHIMLPRKRITVNLAPADVPKTDSGFDLAIAVSILLADGQLTKAIDRRQAFIGELGLDGRTRAVRGIIGKILTGRARGIETFYIPAANLEQAQLVPRVSLVPVASLRELHDYFSGYQPLKPFATGSGRYRSPRTAAKTEVQLSEVVGQAQAKRALEIAASGGHNILFNGPPGTGKSMLAKALKSILPPLTREEALEVTHLHSLAGHDYEKIIAERPFRSPHHSASHVAIIGGGSTLRPGEISLAHRGVLFLDELPEFERDALEALRQPLEDHYINVARAKEVAEYPASFVLAATANPCPCGYYGTARCRCNEFERKRYRQKLSGPILDRIDLYTPVHEIRHDRLLPQTPDPAADAAVRDRVVKARRRQERRYGHGKLNTDMTNADIKRFVRLEPEARQVLNDAAGRVNLSARAYMRTVKIARTIADLEPATIITAAHISEALAYRSPAVRESEPTKPRIPV